MSEKKAKYLLIVRMDVNAEGEKRLNDWYNNVHIPALMQVPGTLSGRRFVAIQGSPKYTAIYEFDRPGVTESEAWRKAVELTPRPKDLVVSNFSREILQLIYP